MEGTSSKKESKVKVYLHRYFIDAMSAMAQGLFASLLIGTIISTLGTQLNIPLLDEIGGYAKSAAGPAMAVAIGYALQAPPLVLFSLVAVGGAANTLGGAGGPLAVLVLAIIAAELGKLVSKKTKVDIIVTPLVTIFSGCGLAYLFAPYIGTAASSVGNLIMWATTQQPFLMGILVSVIVGVALTLPISSAAICAALGLTGLAGGAAVAGCCAQMIGFAVISFRDNGWGGFFAQGIGTSMLQVPNIIKNPRMGTCGLVGQIGVYTGWLNDIAAGAKTAVTAMDWLGLVLICFVLPAVLSFVFDLIFRKIGWVKDGDMKIDA